MRNWGNCKFNPHVKARDFSEIAPNIAFPEFNFYELYYSTFEKSELGRIKKLLPLREMAENFGLVRKSMRPKLGRRSFFTPEGKVALMFLNMYAGLSCPKLLEQLNGNIHYQIFCDVIIDPTWPLTNYKLLDDIMMELAGKLKIQQLQGILADLWDDAPEIIKVNGGRWIIEDCFRLTKTELEARPVFLQRDDRITAHFLTCFLALIIYKYLAKKVNRAGEKFSPDQIIGTLQDMNFLKVTGEGYIPTYTRTDLTNHLHSSAGFRTDTQIVTKKAMKSIIASIKTSRQ